MKKVVVQPGCISCGSCQYHCPAVFKVTDRSRVQEGVDFTLHSEKIKEAAKKCPVQVISYEE